VASIAEEPATRADTSTMNRWLLALMVGGLSSFPCLAQPSAPAAQPASQALDTGTDPTRFSRVAEAKFEYLDLRGGSSSNTWRLSFTQPLGEKRDYSIRFRMPITSSDVRGYPGYGAGDGSVQLAHVFGLTPHHGFVAQGELIFDTASRPELGTGKNTFKGTLIYARFLENGSIFAPAFVQNTSLWGDADRPRVNVTTLDFYYVPKFEDPRTLMTFDPALNFDWTNDKRFFSLQVTAGRVVGSVLGGNLIAFVKPSVFAGADRPSSWGIEVGVKILGF
jgi:hypothetical protein